MIKDQGIGIANPWTTVRGSCRIGELFNCLTEGLAGVQGSKFKVRGCWRIDELGNCRIEVLSCCSQQVTLKGSNLSIARGETPGFGFYV